MQIISAIDIAQEVLFISVGFATWIAYLDTQTMDKVDVFQQALLDLVLVQALVQALVQGQGLMEDNHLSVIVVNSI
jgi:hypothetical protein